MTLTMIEDNNIRSLKATECKIFTTEFTPNSFRGSEFGINPEHEGKDKTIRKRNDTEFFWTLFPE